MSNTSLKMPQVYKTSTRTPKSTYIVKIKLAYISEGKHETLKSETEMLGFSRTRRP